MSQPNRLRRGGRIDRRQTLEFIWNGQRYEGYQGDTLASALLANGVRIIGRSFKYHRPRGIVGTGAEEPNAIFQVGEGARTIPNLRATQTELYEGLSARSVNGWPSPEFDLMGVTGWFSRMLPAGFYYKTFMWPKSLWMKYEHYIRKAAGLGVSPTKPDPDRYDKTYAHCDVLVVGGGPAGLAAALAASRGGARVMLVDEQNEFGGSLLGSRETLDGAPAMAWVEQAVAELQGMAEVKLLPRSTVYGYYDHNFLTILERIGDHLPPGAVQGPRQRLWRVRAKEVVLATGAIERPLVFSNNDRPGVMLASAVSTYINRYAVKPGSRAVVFTNNDGAYQTALDMLDADITVAAVVDARANPNGDLPNRVRERNVRVVDNHVVMDIQGGKKIEGARIMELNSVGAGVIGDIEGIGCGLVAISGGWNPAVHLHCQSGGKAHWDETKACFVPGQSLQRERSAGGCNGAFALGDCLTQGFAAGAEAAKAAGCDADGVPSAPKTVEIANEPLWPLWVVPSHKPIGRCPKQFLDLQNDTAAADILLAVREGYRSIEHVKRYTALGFGTDQGKLGNINGMAILAGALGDDIPATGTTTFRPAYTPVTFGAVAGRDLGDIFEPIRKTAIHGWHEENGAEFENVGQWKRPWYYPKEGETMHQAVDRECLVTRHSVGVMDASTLGKIDVQGPDAGEFLNRLYTNAWKKLKLGHCRYGLMLKEDGMVMDDGVGAHLGENHYYMTTTTGGAAAVLVWMERWLQTEWPELEVHLTSVTDHWATIAVVGPNSRNVLTRLCQDIDFSKDAFPFMTVREGTVAGVPARVFRISFSGELAYEININAHHGRYVWERVMEAGADYDITPYGTETMHVLRAEKGYIIVGQDTDGSVTPVDLGMQWIIGKKDFIGKRSLDRPEMHKRYRKQLVGLLTRNPNEVIPEGAQLVEDPSTRRLPVPMIGHVSSSYYSAALGHSIALALVKGGHKRMGQTVYAPLADGHVIPATITGPVFYDPEGARQNV